MIQLIIIELKVSDYFQLEISTYKTSKFETPSSISLNTTRRRFCPKSLKKKKKISFIHLAKGDILILSSPYFLSISSAIFHLSTFKSCGEHIGRK